MKLKTIIRGLNNTINQILLPEWVGCSMACLPSRVRQVHNYQLHLTAQNLDLAFSISAANRLPPRLQL